MYTMSFIMYEKCGFQKREKEEGKEEERMQTDFIKSYTHKSALSKNSDGTAIDYDCLKT